MLHKVIFLIFIFLGVLSQYVLENSSRLIVYEISGSKSAVSVIGSVTAFVFVFFSTFSGTIVDAISRKFFIYLQLIVGFTLSTILFGLFYYGHETLSIVFGFVFLTAVLSSFASASKNSIFYDIVGEKDLVKWISWRSIVVSSAILFSFFVVVRILGEIQSSLIIYAALLVFSMISFIFVRYKDQNISYKLADINSFWKYIGLKLKDFSTLFQVNRMLRMLFILAFAKTALIFWPMSSGALFKFGIEDQETQKIYLYASALMQVTTIISIYIIGRYVRHFSIKSFIFGIIVSGLGIVLFSRAESTIFLIGFLAILYVGLAISQMSWNYILRFELPNEFRTQGLSFSVVPYYLGDFVSGLLFALLISIFSTSNLLLAAGILLFFLGLFSYFKLIKPSLLS